MTAGGTSTPPTATSTRCAQTSEQHDTLFENVGGKRFVDVSRESGEHFARRGYQRGQAFADLNNDGFLDIVVTSLGRRPAILLNSGGRARTGSTSLRAAASRTATASGRGSKSRPRPAGSFMTG